jgi:dihydrofolate synthase/folylpolyglutamate synthase
MFRLQRFGIKLGLGTIRRILASMGDPHLTYRCIHVAGTNGKGSVASALAAVLTAAGHRTGLFTSPHLVRFNERIQIDGALVEDEDVVRSYRVIRSIDAGSREPTFFEFSAAMAFSEFGRRQVDWAVIETGMGGRLDATNIVQPALTVITNISLEHRMYLGNTIAEIAREKAGIIKPRIPVVTGARQPAARQVIASAARSVDAPVFCNGMHFRVRRQSAGGTFSYYGMDGRWKRLRTGLTGDFQVDNAALVMAACELLRRSGIALPEQAIRSGLARNRWPGRLEQVMDRPLVILDGAHNRMAARRLGEFMQRHLTGRQVTLVVGILDDKPYAAMLKDLVPHCRKVIVTRPRIDRALPPERLASIAERFVNDVTIHPDVADAVRCAVAEAAPEDAVVIAGSLYVVGEAKSCFE